ncbi:MAG: tryptophan synthase subunit alpha [Vicinamibacterales bacterium]
MPRISDAFARMRDERRVGLVTYVTAGDPSLERTADILRALDRAGADLVEVGVPFSDPLADGPIIQRACERALSGGATLGRVLDLVEEVRPSVRAPIVLFSYANPLYRMGFERFASRAASAGVDGVLALDIPVEEAGPLRQALLRRALDPIYLVSPTTSPERARAAGEAGRGFLYLISRAGVTGARERLAEGLPAIVSRVRAVSSLPLAVGFGLSRPEHVRAVADVAEAAVVGSALVSVVADAGDTPALVPRVERYVRWLRGAEDAGGLQG